MLTLAQRRHWLATSPSEFQRRANVSLLLDDDGHSRKSIYLKVFFSPCVVNFIDFNALIHTLIALHVGPIKFLANVGPMDKMTLAQRNDIRWPNVGPTSEC